MNAGRTNPLWYGVTLGMVMLASFALAGRGIGASGAFAVTGGRLLAAAGVGTGDTAPPALVERLPGDVDPWDDWLVFEVLGVFIGGAIAARVAGSRPVSEAARAAPERQLRTFAGGTLMGLGARLAWGCTSGLALTGGALLATGAWIFIPIAFGAAILVTRLARQGARHA